MLTRIFLNPHGSPSRNLRGSSADNGNDRPAAADIGTTQSVPRQGYKADEKETCGRRERITAVMLKAKQQRYWWLSSVLLQPYAFGKALAPQPCPNLLRPLRRWTLVDPVPGRLEPIAATPLASRLVGHCVGSLQLRRKAPPDSAAVMHTLPLQVAPAKFLPVPESEAWHDVLQPMAWAPKRSEGRRPTSY